MTDTPLSRANDKGIVKDKILRWLLEEGQKYEFLDNPIVDYQIRFLVGANETEVGIDAIIPKHKIDSVVLATTAQFNDDDRKAYARLKPDQQTPFILALQGLLSELDIDYEYQPNPEELEFIPIAKTLFFETLTKQAFFDTVRLLLRAIKLANLCYGGFLARD